MKRKGFTLIELLVVIAIIGLLSTLSVVSLNSARGRARDAARKSDMNAISTALELFNVESDDGTYPGDATSSCPESSSDAYGETLAVAPGVEAAGVLCIGDPIVTDAGDTVLQAIPEPPTENGYVGRVLKIQDGSEEKVVGYCISAQLEKNNPTEASHFKCVNGSCYLDGAGCGESDFDHN